MYNSKFMNTVVIRNNLAQIASNLSVGKQLVLGAFVGLFLFDGARERVIASLVDAYFQVSVFVAMTLLVLLVIEQKRERSLSEVLTQYPNAQVVIAALLGALPGCGGAIIVTTQYVRGAISFGSLVAVLTATMGDAAFLLLSQSPLDALLVYGICLVTGIVSGYTVDRIHGRSFLRKKRDVEMETDEVIEENSLLQPLYKLWICLLIPGVVIGVLVAFQIEAAEVLRVAQVDWVTPLGVVAGALAIFMWFLNPLSDIRLCTASANRRISRQVCDTTNFVTTWVVLAYICYDLLILFAGLDLGQWFAEWPGTVIAFALLIGFIPGCGPQIVVTSLYLSGSLPFSAQLANAISNDGDALFPAIAIAPKAALIATIYSAIPAVFVAYGWHLLFE